MTLRRTPPPRVSRIIWMAPNSLLPTPFDRTAKLKWCPIGNYLKYFSNQRFHKIIIRNWLTCLRNRQRFALHTCLKLVHNIKHIAVKWWNLYHKTFLAHHINMWRRFCLNIQVFQMIFLEKDVHCLFMLQNSSFFPNHFSVHNRTGLTYKFTVSSTLILKGTH